MTHSELIAHMGSAFSDYRELWSQNLDETEDLGAFVFLPGKDLEWEWWSVIRPKNIAH